MIVLRRIFLTAFAFAIVHVGSAIISWIILPCLRRRIAGLPESAQQRRLEHFFLARDQWLIKRLVNFGLLDFEAPVIPEWFSTQGPFMVVCNHPTLVDIFILRAAIPGLTSVVKSSLFNLFYFKPMLQASGDFPGPEGRDDATFGQTTVLDRFVEKLKSGRSVIVFPEGTRSPAWGLRRFRRGAVEAAQRANSPVLPLFLAVNPPVLTKEDTFFAIGKQRARARIEFMSPISVKDRTSQDITRELQSLYAAKLEVFARQCQTQPSAP
jgi:1-acyl-sn-glycerol-3-phosphate acyltransferase